MKVSEIYTSSYLKSADLNGQVKRAVIDTVTMETLRDGTKKLCAWFKNTDRGLVLNKTNSETLAKAFGDDTDHWSSKRIELFTMTVQGPNGLVEGIRVRALGSTPPVKEEPPKPVAAGNGGDFDDDIPF
jgi:hypothetical protein